MRALGIASVRTLVTRSADPARDPRANRRGHKTAGKVRAKDNTASVRASESAGDTPASVLPGKRAAAIAHGRPIAIPSTTVPRRTIRNTPVCDVPSAMRSPISLVRRPIVYEITP
jgi:hypothetical protein